MKVLIISQATNQGYINIIKNALPDNTELHIITGSDISGEHIIKSPKHDPRSFSSRLVCWFKHLFFMKKWIRNNKKNKYDLIFAVSNPPINPYIGLKLKKVFGAPFVYMNWDIYPDIIDNSINNPLVHLICKFWYKWNSKNYTKIDKILTIGRKVAESINRPLKTKADISIIPISVDTERLKPVHKNENFFIKDNNLDGKFIVLYSGKMGYGHNIELILEAAEKLREYKDIAFVFIGAGQKFDLVKNAADLPLNNNIRVFPFQPNDIFPHSMASGDVGIVAQENKLAHLFMPSKTYSMMACGMPIIGICSGEDDLSALIENNKIGYTVTDGESEKLVAYILELYNDKEKLECLKEISRTCAKKRFDVSVITEKYKRLFNKILSGEYDESIND